jgi:DNA-binding FrmR family transcriptional regulator
MLNEQIVEQAGARLRKLSGQLRGIERMIAERRYCVEVLDQIAAVQAALSGLGKLVLRNHIETCVAETLTGGSAVERKKKIEELVAIYGRFCRAT